MTKIFFYTPNFYEAGCTLRTMVENQFSSEKVTILSTISEFTSPHLSLDIRNNDLVIMALKSITELDELLTHRFLLEDIRLVILLPLLDGRDLAKAHLLRPRYLSVGNIDINHVCAVLHKMQNSISNNAPLTQ